MPRISQGSPRSFLRLTASVNQAGAVGKRFQPATAMMTGQSGKGRHGREGIPPARGQLCEQLTGIGQGVIGDLIAPNRRASSAEPGARGASACIWVSVVLPSVCLLTTMCW